MCTKIFPKLLCPEMKSCFLRIQGNTDQQEKQFPVIKGGFNYGILCYSVRQQDLYQQIPAAA